MMSWRTFVNRFSTKNASGKRDNRKKARKNANGDEQTSGSLTILPCRQCAYGASVATPSTPRMAFPTSPLFFFDMPREDVIAAYSV
ncbi:hypothetical protein GGI42DRAFT_337106 [Trichoderma sp. SZMC 28013]